MKPPAVACLIVAFIAALLLTGCGGGGSSAGSSSTAPSARPNPGGPVKKATAPKAPAGSKVVSCATEGAAAEGQGKASGAGERAEVSGLRATATDCGTARAAMRRWERSPACRIRKGDSRASCSLGAYRCQAINVDRGSAVSCARRDGSDVAFIAKRRS